MVEKKRRNPGLELSYLLVWNFGMEPICMETCLGLCLELLVRKPT